MRFTHCGELIYTFTHREESRSLAAGEPAAGVPSGRCPLCGDRLSFRLLDAPVAVPCPLSNGHEAPYAFVISSRAGPTSIWCVLFSSRVHTESGGAARRASIQSQRIDAFQARAAPPLSV